MELIVLLFGCVLFAILWAATGHALWVFARHALNAFSSRPCPSCKRTLAKDDRACRHCGWTSTKVDAKQGFVICRQAIQTAFERKVIDDAARQRAEQSLVELEDALDRDRRGFASRTPPRPPSVSNPSTYPTSQENILRPTPPVPAHAPSLPVTQANAIPARPIARAEVVSISKAPAAVPHALDTDYSNVPQRPMAKQPPTRSWSQWLSAFMEESNIRWGEMVGGLLIVCCSIAMVLSFWEHIAQRPWLKFSIFTGINMSAFGLGLYAWHRWKLPTTSKGILFISMMLLPLNFLAFAIFTLGAPWDWLTVTGELVSLAILGYLAWLAAKVLTPHAVGIMTATPILFAILNLLIRRTIPDEASTVMLWGWGGILIAAYASVTGIAWRPLVQKVTDHYLPGLLFLALATFGLALSGSLIYICSGDAWQTARSTSPLLALVALPALGYALGIERRIARRSSLSLAILLIGTASCGVVGLATLLAWPTPWLLIGCASVGLLMLAWMLRHVGVPALGYGIYLLLAVVGSMLWWVGAGSLAWNNASSKALLQTFASAQSGFLIAGGSLLVAAWSVVLARFGQSAHAVVALRSAAGLGLLGTILLTAFGFARPEYGFSVGAVYALYAIAALAIGVVRQRPWVECIGLVFLTLSAFQTLGFGWQAPDTWTKAFSMALACSYGVVLMLMFKAALGQRAAREPILEPYAFISLGLSTVMACAWLYLDETTDWVASPYDPVGNFLIVLCLWGLFAWIRVDRNAWSFAQIFGVVTACVATYLNAKSQLWLDDVELRVFHPMLWQWWILTAMTVAFILGLLDWFVRWSKSIPMHAAMKTFATIHDRRVAQSVIVLGATATVGLLVYGAGPGTLQELLPRDALSATQTMSYSLRGETSERIIPSLSALELSWSPHAAAGWGIGSASYNVLWLKPGAAVWLVSLLTMILSVRSIPRPRRGSWTALTMTVGLSIWFPLATIWESEVAVASALRWITSLALVIGSLGLCIGIRRLDRTKRIETTRALARFDRRFGILASNALAVWLSLGAIVLVAALVQVPDMPWSIWAWTITSIAAFFAVALAVAHGSQRIAPARRNVSSAPIITSVTLLLTPLVIWLVMQVAVTVLAHPLTGPNPGSLFASMGLAVSYAVPILLVSIALMMVSASRPSPQLAFVAACFLMVTVVVGYMLALKARGLRPDAWVGLLAALSATACVFCGLWRWFLASVTSVETMEPDRMKSLTIAREQWQRSLLQISAGFSVIGVLLAAFLMLANGPWIIGLRNPALGLIASLFVLGAILWFERGGLESGRWLLGFGLACAGVLAPWWTSSVDSLSSVAGVVGLAGAALIGFTGYGLADRTTSRSFWIMLAYLVLIAGRLLFANSFVIGPFRTGPSHAVWVLVGASLLALAHAWMTRERVSMLGALITAQLAGFVMTLWVNPASNVAAMGWETLFVQCAIMAIFSLFGSALGFGARVRIPLHFANVLLSLVCGLWLIESLMGPSDTAVAVYPWLPFLIAIVSVLCAGVAGYWQPHAQDTDRVVYLAGLYSVTWFLQWLQPTAESLLWLSTIVLGAYCLASSFAWRAGDRVLEELGTWIWLPKPVQRRPAVSVIYLNIGLAILVTAMALGAQFHNPSMAIRFMCANTIMAVSFAVGFLARYTSRKAESLQARESEPAQRAAAVLEEGSTWIRVLALILGLLFAVALGWHVQTPGNADVLDRVGVAMLPCVLMGAAYGFGMVKWMGLKEQWQRASVLLMPAIVAIAIAGGILCISLEWLAIDQNPSTIFNTYTSFSIGSALVIALFLCLAGALLPGRDPLGLSERGREVYVYVAQGLLVLGIVHLRLTQAWLFQGLFQPFWPIFVMLLGFVGLALAEWSRARGLRVLVHPLTNSGMLLPLLPTLAPWIASSSVNYGVTLTSASVGYGLFAYLQRSPLFGAASVLSANGAIWYFLHRSQFTFQEHPQLWVIPPALCVFVAAHTFRSFLAPRQLAMVRYLSVGSIYIASTSEIFLQGIAKAPWLPMVLAGLSVLGIFFGIASRIRSMLWLGSLFLCIALFTIIWYAAVDLEQTWIWYASGIVLGILILTMFAMFEKRREDLNRIMANMQKWEE